MDSLLERLCRAHGISGFEGEVVDLMKRELSKSSDDVEVDSFGNIVARKGKGRKRIMLAAHTDEVGLMVKHISKEGFLNFVKIGGVDDQILLSQRVSIKTKKGYVAGVIGSKPIHLKKDEEKKKLVKYDEMFIDIGADDEKEAKKMVEVGDPVCFEPNFGKLTVNRYYGKALDNRLGCYALLKIMEKIPKNVDATLYAVGTAQEDVGLKGAKVSAFRLEPDYAIAIDTTTAGGTPGIKDIESDLKIGKGPAVTITEAAGRGLISHSRIRNMLVEAARKNKIPYQIDVIEGGMTDAAAIYLTRGGVPTGCVSIPTRYIHCTSGVFDRRDIENTVKLIVSAVKGF